MQLMSTFISENSCLILSSVVFLSFHMYERKNRRWKSLEDKCAKVYSYTQVTCSGEVIRFERRKLFCTGTICSHLQSPENLEFFVLNASCKHTVCWSSNRATGSVCDVCIKGAILCGLCSKCRYELKAFTVLINYTITFKICCS